MLEGFGQPSVGIVNFSEQRLSPTLPSRSNPLWFCGLGWLDPLFSGIVVRRVKLVLQLLHDLGEN